MYQKTANSVYSLYYHIILTVKYRKKLMHQYDSFIKQTILDLSNNHKFQVDKMESDQDHIHLLVFARPDISPSQIVRVIKQKTAYELWNNYEIELVQHFWKRRTFWNRSSFISSVGVVDKSVIEHYINQQGK